MVEAFARTAPAAPWLVAAWPRATICFALLALGLIALFEDAAASMAAQWIRSSTYHHGIAVAPIALWLVHRREDWRRTQPTSCFLGAAIVLAASVAWLIGRAASVAVIGHMALVLALIGAVVAVYGRALASRWAFPLAFLLFMIPFGEEATPVLQEWAAVVVAALLNFSGVETARDGFMLTTSAGRFEMAQSCAGLRFLLAAAMISSLVAYLAFTTWRKRLVFVAAALALAVVANWARAYLIVVVATATDGGVGKGPEHVALGWLFYSALVVGLLVVAHRFRDTVAVKSQAGSREGQSAPSSAPAAVALIAAAAFALYDGLVVSANVVAAKPRHLPPYSADGFRSATPSLGWRPSTAGAELVATAAFASDDAEVLTSVAYFAYDRRGAEIVGSELRAADGVEWRRVAVARERISSRELTAPILIETLENDSGARADVASFYWLGDKAFASAAAVKLRVAAGKLIGRREPGGAAFIAAPHQADADPRAAIRSFLARGETVADWRKRIEP